MTAIFKTNETQKLDRYIKVFPMTPKAALHVCLLEKGDRILIFDGVKTPLKATIVNIINHSMFCDLEFVLNKSKRHYFTLNKFLTGKSWVKSFQLLPEKDKRIIKKDRANEQKNFN